MNNFISIIIIVIGVLWVGTMFGSFFWKLFSSLFKIRRKRRWQGKERVY